jgi:hypothetical protein
MRGYTKAMVTVTALALAGCANFTSSLGPNAKPDPRLGYLYARLTLTGEGGQGFCHLRAGLTLQQVDGSGSYNMEFDPEADVVAIPVKPGTYRVHSLIYTSCDSEVLGERVIPASETRPFKVDAGTVCYIVDLVVQAGMDPNAVGIGKGGEAPVGETEMTWQVTSIKDNRLQTTQDFHARYPDLAGLPPSGARP